MKIACFSALLAFILYGCVEPYVPEVGSYESTLVVDGAFTNGTDTLTVILSRSFSYKDKQPEYIRGATVVIEDDQGARVALTENSPGYYQNDPASLQGQTGRSYRLLITTPDGNQFESDWELMKPSPPVGEVNYEYQERMHDDPTERPTPGLQFFVNTKDPENKTRYYRWEYEETYEYTLWNPPFFYVRFGNPVGTGKDGVQEVPGNEFEGFYCWKTEYSKKLFVATTDGLSEDVVIDYPLHFVDNLTPKFSQRYSLLVKQYAISKDYYEYLRKLEETNQTTGSLFDPIPNEVFGNVRSADGKDIPVLGYFSVAGVSTSRIFVNNNDDLPTSFLAPVGPVCVVDTIPLDYKILYDRLRFRQNVFYNLQYSPFGDPIGFLLTQPPCSKCANLGATNQRPEYW